MTATDLAMVGVSIPGYAVGGSDARPAAGGVFEVLQKASFDPRITEGPNNCNDGDPQHKWGLTHTCRCAMVAG